MSRKTINVEDSTHAQLVELAGKTRLMQGVLSGLVDWAHRSDRDLLPVLLDDLSPEAEVRVLEVLLARAHGRLSAVSALDDATVQSLRESLNTGEISLQIIHKSAGTHERLRDLLLPVETSVDSPKPPAANPAPKGDQPPVDLSDRARNERMKNRRRR